MLRRSDDHHHTRIGLLLFFLLGAGCFAVAQPESNGSDHAPSQRKWTLSGEMYFRVEARKDPDFSLSHQDDRALARHRLRAAVLASPTDEFELFAQIQDSRIWGEEGTSLGSNNRIMLHQGYARWQLPGDFSPRLKVGRQTMTLDSGWLVGAYEYHPIGRAFNALAIAWERPVWQWNSWISPVRDRNGDGIMRSQYFGGTHLRVQPRPSISLSGYTLLLHDDRNFNSLLELPPELIGVTTETQMTAWTGGGHLSASLPIGVFAELEAARQWGAIGILDIAAWAIHGEVGYRLPISMQPSVAFGGAYASGDQGDLDNQLNTFINLFPDVHNRLGAMDVIGWSNISAQWFSLGAALGPVVASIDVYRFALAQQHDHWYGPGGFLAASDSEIYRNASQELDPELGYEIDFHLRSQETKVGWSFSLAAFLPGPHVKDSQTEEAVPQLWGNASIVFKFGN